MQPPETYDTPEKLAIAAAEKFVDCYKQACDKHDSFHVALSGGTTPKRLYQLLTTDKYQKQLEWKKIHFYFGDERFVALDHNDSNFNMANQALFSQINCPAENIHNVPVGEANIENAVKIYADQIRQTISQSTNNIPEFDLVLLGLGPDGHTASLFPGTLALQESEAIYTSVYIEKFASWRTTLTFPIINQAKCILLLSEGKSKRDIIKALTKTSKNELTYPVQQIKPKNNFYWYADIAAYT